MIDLRHSVNRKEMPENENPDKVFDIVEEIHNFNKNQKVKGDINYINNINMLPY